MKKRGVLLLCLLYVLLLPTVFAEEELVYSGTIESGKSIDVDGTNFEFIIDSQSSKVHVEVDLSGLIIESGDCRVKETFNICIKNISFSYRNYEQWYDVYSALVDIYQAKSSL